MIRAIVFDFNGTLSDDEPVLCEIWQAIASEHGRPLSREEYYEQLAGLADPEIAARWLGEGADVEAAMAERVRRYRDLVADGSTVGPEMRAVVRYAAERVPLAMVTGAAHEDVDLVLAAAGLTDAFPLVVATEDVRAGKPDPEGYLRALDLLGVAAEEALAFEDSEVGVLAAKAAGLRCYAVLGTAAPERLEAADAIVERIDVELVRSALED